MASSGKSGGGGRRGRASARHATEMTSRKRTLPKSRARAAPVQEVATPPVASSRAAFLVLGMHRSGTSLLAGLLQRLGATWPKTLIAPNESNPKGYGESVAFMRVHDRLLASAGSSWTDWSPFNPDWAESGEAHAFEDELNKVFDEEYGEAHLVVMKDPRACRFAGFWIDLLKRRGIRPLPLITVRNPLEVAASVHRRDGMAVMLGLLLWLRHVLDAEQATRGMPRAFVSYTDILEDWRSVAADIRSRVGVRWPRMSRVIELEIDELVDRSLHREVATDEAALARRDIAEWVRRVYTVLLDISKQGESPAAHRILDAVREEFDKSSSVFGVLTRTLENVAQTAQAEAERLTGALAALSLRERGLDRKATALWREVETSRDRVDALQTQLNSLKSELRKREEREQKARQELSSAAEKAGALETRIAALTSDLSAASDRNKASQAQSEAWKQELSQAHEKNADLERRAVGLAAEVTAANERAAAAEAQVADASRNLAVAEDAISSLDARLASTIADLDAAWDGVKAAEARAATELSVSAAALETSNQKLLVSEARAESLARNLAEAAERARTSDGQIEQLTTDLIATSARAQAADSRIQGLTQTLSEATEAIKAAGADLRALTAERDALATRCEDQAASIARSEADKQQLVGDVRVAREGLGMREHELADVRAVLAQVDAARQEAEDQLTALADRHAATIEALEQSQLELSQGALEYDLLRLEEARAHEEAVANTLREQAVDLERALRAARERIGLLEASLETAQRVGGENAAPPPVQEIAPEIESDASLVRSQMFDVAYYARQLVKHGVKASGDAVEHYLNEGAALRLNPHPDFDTVWYLHANPDVARSGENPLVHYLRHGKNEGRSGNPKFDLNSSTYNGLRPYTLAPVHALNETARHYAQARKDGKAKIAVYCAITGGYDDICFHEHLDPAIDYHLFTDGPREERFAFQMRPLPYFDTDPTRAARYVKTHPHMLLPGYEIAIWVDGNILIRGDLTPDIEAFRDSGLAVAAVPHPLRTTVYEEADECSKRSKDDDATMRKQVERYRVAGFNGEGLIESNFMMFRLGHPQLPAFLGAWWAELEKGSRRDQLSLSYALQAAGVDFFPLTHRPNSVRNHKSLALFHHGSHKRPAEAELVAAVVPARRADSYAQERERRISAQRKRFVDVIVCVHNALDVVKSCLESVARYRNAAKHRVVIVNDGSGPETTSWLEAFAAGHANVKLIRHTKAGGYTRAANAGLRAIRSDLAILLNSDTIVSANWIEKMTDAVYSNPGAGIVGPMSSAASTQSLPDHKSTATQTAINDLPPGFTVDDMNRWCEENSPADFVPRVPLVHGFCFGVTREVIEKIGYFSAEHFPHGYGEENDYCFRAVNAGFSPVIATHTYVYHKKSQSYQDERRAQLMKAGNDKIRELHGKDRVVRAVKAMQENPYLSQLRALSLALFQTGRKP